MLYPSTRVGEAATRGQEVQLRPRIYRQLNVEDRWHILGHLGKGAFGVVFLAQSASGDGKKVCGCNELSDSCAGRS